MTEDTLPEAHADADSLGRNTLLLRSMRAAGIKTVAELERRLGANFSQQELGRICNGKAFGRLKNGEWSKAANALANLFDCLPDDIFDEAHQWPDGFGGIAETLKHDEIDRRTSNLGSDLPDETFAVKELGHNIRKFLQTLTPREERILRLRFGIDIPSEQSLEEVGVHFSITKERARQIEAKALRKMKHPYRSHVLATFLPGRELTGRPSSAHAASGERRYSIRVTEKKIESRMMLMRDLPRPHQDLLFSLNAYIRADADGRQPFALRMSPDNKGWIVLPRSEQPSVWDKHGVNDLAHLKIFVPMPGAESSCLTVSQRGLHLLRHGMVSYAEPADAVWQAKQPTPEQALHAPSP